MGFTSLKLTIIVNSDHVTCPSNRSGKQSFIPILFTVISVPVSKNIMALKILLLAAVPIFPSVLNFRPFVMQYRRCLSSSKFFVYALGSSHYLTNSLI